MNKYVPYVVPVDAASVPTEGDWTSVTSEVKPSPSPSKGASVTPSSTGATTSGVSGTSATTGAAAGVSTGPPYTSGFVPK